MQKNIKTAILSLLVVMMLSMTACQSKNDYVWTEETDIETDEPSGEVAKSPDDDTASITETEDMFQYNEVPQYSGQAVYKVHNNEPYFTKKEITDKSFEDYMPLDKLGRCQTATACLGTETLPDAPRGDIGQIKPAGWHTVKYPEYINGSYLYNRCHLIAYELSAENANEKNLITGTRYMNVSGMLPYENMTTDYIENTKNHVMYRATPIFVDDELVCRGVLLEGLSVEDKGVGLKFCVFCYDIQPNISIDYATGDSKRSPGFNDYQPKAEDDTAVKSNYVLNNNTMTFHKPDCSSVAKMSDKNKSYSSAAREQIMDEGYEPCQICNP